MFISYCYTGYLGHLTSEELSKLEKELGKSPYDWEIEGDEVIVEGEISVNPEFVSSQDVEDEIKGILWYTAEVDSDGTVVENYLDDYIPF